MVKVRKRIKGYSYKKKGRRVKVRTHNRTYDKSTKRTCPGGKIGSGGLGRGLGTGKNRRAKLMGKRDIKFLQKNNFDDWNWLYSGGREVMPTRNTRRTRAIEIPASATFNERYAILKDAGVLSPYKHAKLSSKVAQDVKRMRKMGASDIDMINALLLEGIEKEEDIPRRSGTKKLQRTPLRDKRGEFIEIDI